MESIESLIEPYTLHSRTVFWIEKAVESSFYPDRARVNFERFLERVIQTDAELLSKLNKRNIQWISLLFSGSQMLTDLAMKEPTTLFWAMQPSVLGSTRFKAEMRRERDSLLKKVKNLKNGLCLFKLRELMRIGWRDLLKWADTVETLEDLSRLADVSIQGALSIAESEMTAKFGDPLNADGKKPSFIVLGMGKLGGRELNFSSDIDLIYILKESNGETKGGRGRNHLERPKISLEEYYTRVSQRLTAILNDVGPVGTIYRVDLDLRPEGKRGTIVTSLSSALLYYDSWSQPWERQMLIKARVVAGNPEFGDVFLNKMRPFIYRKSLDYSHINEIYQMKEKIDRHLTKGRDKYKNNVKLGKGGIREVEFIIQTYQLIYGGKMPWLAEANSLKALHRIFERGLLGNIQYVQLADGLLFLRDLENRMQITYGRQVQILPEDEEDLNSLALKMNLENKDELLKEYERVTDNIHAVFTEFFTEEDDEPRAQTSRYFIDLDSEEDAIVRLEELRFPNPRFALQTLLHIRDGEPFNHPSSKSRRLFTNLLPELIEPMTKLPGKDKTLANLDKFFESQSEREGIYTILLELPSSREILMLLFSLAQSLSDIMINHPDASDILSSGVTISRKNSLVEVHNLADSYDAKINWLRKERNGESLRIGINYLFTHNNPFVLMKHLSELASEYLENALRLVEEEQSSKTKLDCTKGSSFAVIGMGKLGRGELNYGSDLDIVFVYSPAENCDESALAETASHYTVICRKLLNAVSGISQHGHAYRVDTRLRPEGEKGLIVITKNSAIKYYKQRGELWEKMALSGARVVAGDKEFGEAFIEELSGFVYGDGLSLEDKQKMNRMKEKIEREKIKQIKKINIKYGVGGIVDMEFLAQQIKLANGKTVKEIRNLNTLELFEYLKENSLPSSEDVDPLPLINTYKLLRTIETHLRMEDGQESSYLPDKPEKLRALQEKMERFINLDGSIVDLVKDGMIEVAKSVIKK